MRKLVNLSLILVAVTLLFPSCVGKKKFTELLSSKEATDAALAQTQAELKTLEGEKEELMMTKSELETKNAQLSSDLSSATSNLNQASSALETAQTNLSAAEIELAKAKESIKGVFNPYANSGLVVTQRDNRLYVGMEEPITFRSGSTRLGRKYRDAIKGIAEVLKANPGLSIQVEGHSDNAKFVSGQGNNWTLSMNRAMSVMNMLLKEGVSPNQVSAVGRGEFAPIAGEDPNSAEARARNRRVEFVVVPDLSSLGNVTP